MHTVVTFELVINNKPTLACRARLFLTGFFKEKLLWASR